LTYFYTIHLSSRNLASW